MHALRNRAPVGACGSCRGRTRNLRKIAPVAHVQFHSERRESDADADADATVANANDDADAADDGNDDSSG